MSRLSVPLSGIPHDSGISRSWIPPVGGIHRAEQKREIPLMSGISRSSGFRSLAGFVERNKERNKKRTAAVLRTALQLRRNPSIIPHL